MNEEIMNVTETKDEDTDNLVRVEDYSEEECESGSLLGTIVKVGGGILIGYAAGKIISRAKPKIQEIKEKHAKRKAAKKQEASAPEEEDVVYEE